MEKRKLVLTSYFRDRRNLHCKETSFFKRKNQVDIIIFLNFFCIYDTLHDLVPLVQFKKREKHPRRNVTFSKAAGWSNPPSPCVFFTFLNCADGTKSCNASHITICTHKICICSFWVISETGKRSISRGFLYSIYLKNCGHN